ncbi:hypothetical protein [Pseudomonas lactis]|uniref:hypothetical protein n=1 Tax=Pseudomonas lactis TaxID=1615674 RepID=UPI001FC8F160|nr:hypothetical protein [Pseudomonas lactis]
MVQQQYPAWRVVVGKQAFAEGFLPIAVGIFTFALFTGRRRKQLQWAVLVVFRIGNSCRNNQQRLVLGIAVHREHRQFAFGQRKVLRH